MEWVEPVSAHVRAIDPSLDWEFGAGRVARHYFCVSAKGDPVLRVTAERWRAAGPRDDESFEYHAARPGGGYHPARSIRFDEHEVHGDGFLFVLERDMPRRRVHLEAVWHPSFAAMPESLRATATFISLDNVLGEDDVERYVGAMKITTERPGGAVGFEALVETVGELGKSPETFTLLRGTLDGGAPIFVTARLDIKRVDHLLMDLHVEIAIALAEPTEHGLTKADEAERLNAAEDALTGALAHDAVYIGRETARGARTLHFHVAQAGPALARIDAWTREQPWSIEVRSRLDPTWEILRRW